jgi:hypothetical protein
MWKRDFHVRLDAHTYVSGTVANGCDLADDIDIVNPDDLHRQRV